MISIDQIISRCKQYDKFAQKLLYERYAPAMNGLCMRYTSDSDTVKDLLQEGFIKVFSNIKQFKGNGSFDGWIKRIFINTAISHIRKNTIKNKQLNIDEIEESRIIETTDSSFDEADGINIFEKKGVQNNFKLVQSADFSEIELLEVLNKVPEKYRLVFNLYFIENIKHEEIAEMLSIDVVTSRTRLLRARIIIQNELYLLSIAKLSS